MKTRHLLILIATSALALASCGTTSSLGGVKPYPLKVCLVTDNDLDSMGDQQTHNYNGQQLKFCCDACWDKFLKNPAKYLAKLPKS